MARTSFAVSLLAGGFSDEAISLFFSPACQMAALKLSMMVSWP
jgi:hypothetical protein